MDRQEWTFAICLNRCRKVWIRFTLQRTDRLNGRIASLEDKLEHYQMIEKEIRKNMEKLEGLEYRIAKCRCFQWVRAIFFSIRTPLNFPPEVFWFMKRPIFVSRLM